MQKLGGRLQRITGSNEAREQITARVEQVAKRACIPEEIMKDGRMVKRNIIDYEWI